MFRRDILCLCPFICPGLDGALDRIKTPALKQPSVKTTHPFKAAVGGDMKILAKGGRKPC